MPSPTAAFQDTSLTNPDLLVDESAPSPSPLTSPSPTPATSPLAASPAASAVRISMTDTGFSPASVTVPAGTTVTFVNNGQASHWPASATHPTHDVLPEFDSQRGIATGEEYSFTFTQAGTWKYHDHLFPQLTGQIVVQ